MGDGGTNRKGIKFRFPALSNRLTRLISKSYQVILVDESRSSKVCSALYWKDGKLKVCGKLLDSFLGKKKDNKYVQQYGVKVSNNNNDDHNINDDDDDDDQSNSHQ